MTETRVTEYTLLPTQYKFLYGFDKELLNKDEVYLDVSLYQGGFGSGKTFVGSLRGLTYALQWAGCKGLVGAASQDLLDGTTKMKYLEHMENIGLKEGVHWWYKDRKQTIEFMNGSQIRFKTLSDWSQFRSTEFTWIEIEEASLIDEKTFKELMARIRETKRYGWENYHRSMFLHTNPQGARGWMYKFFHNPKTKIKSYRAYIAASKENHHLGENYVSNLEDLYSADEIKELLEGVDNDYDNTIAFPYFNATNIKDDIKYDPNVPLVLSCDFNYNPMCWYLMQEKEGCWYVLRELIDNNVTTEEHCRTLLEAVRDCHTNKLIIMGDAHGKDKKTNGSDYAVMLSYLEDHGIDCELRVQKANPLIKERLAILRRLIRNGKGVSRLFVNSNCKWLLYNFEECKNNLGNGGIKIPTDTDIQKDDNKRYLVHPIDAVSYAMWYLDSLRAIAGKQMKL